MNRIEFENRTGVRLKISCKNCDFSLLGVCQLDKKPCDDFRAISCTDYESTAELHDISQYIDDPLLQIYSPDEIYSPDDMYLSVKEYRAYLHSLGVPPDSPSGGSGAPEEK